MSDDQPAQRPEVTRERAAAAGLALRSMGEPNSVRREFDFWDDSYEGRRLFCELFGTFLLVLVAVGGGIVNARFGGSAIPLAVRVTTPGPGTGSRTSRRC